MAGDKSEFHWYGTFALILAPGLFVGALIGLAEHRRRTGGSRTWWLTLSPCLFLAALADPTIFKAADHPRDRWRRDRGGAVNYRAAAGTDAAAGQ